LEDDEKRIEGRIERCRDWRGNIYKKKLFIFSPFSLILSPSKIKFLNK
jgi:hypothetical protein